MKLLKYSILLFGLFLAQGVFAQTNEICEISSISFEYQEPIKEDTEITLRVKPSSNICGNQKKAFQLEIIEVDGGLGNLDKTVNDNVSYSFKSDGSDFTSTFVPGNEYCEDANCEYYIKATIVNSYRAPGARRDTISTTIHSSDFDESSIDGIFKDNPNTLEQARISFKPQANNIVEFKEITRQLTTEEENACKIIKVDWETEREIHVDTFIDQKNTATLKIETKNCIDKKAVVTIHDAGTFPDSTADGPIKNVTISEDVVRINYLPGDKGCDHAGENPDCQFYPKITITLIETKRSCLSGRVCKVTYPKQQENKIASLNFNCHKGDITKKQGRTGRTTTTVGPICDKPWEVRSVTGLTDNTPQPVGTATPTFDRTSPCYIPPNTEKSNGEKTGSNGGYDENCYEFLAPIPGFESASGEVVTTPDGRQFVKNLAGLNLGDYIQSLFNIALGILMVLSVVMIVFAGVEYMTVESIYGKSKAKGRITGAVTGLILALGIFLILETINPQLLEINFGDRIDEVGIEVKGYDQNQLNYINNLAIPSVLNYQQEKVFADIGFLGYLYHQQGAGGGSGHLWNAVNNNNPHKSLPWGSISAELLTRQMENNGGIKSPRDFVTYFYEKFQASKRNIEKIPAENIQAIERAAKDVGVDPEALKAMCLIETAGCKDPKTTNSYGYKGLFQFCDSDCKKRNPNSSETWVKPYIRAEGVNIYDPYENAYAAAKLLQENINAFNRNKNRILN